MDGMEGRKSFIRIFCEEKLKGMWKGEGDGKDGKC